METAMNMSRDTALRIALAARALPGTSVGQLLEILHDQLGSPLNEKTLQKASVTDLKIGLAGSEEDVDMLDTPMSALKEAVRILWGETTDEALPKPVKVDQLPENSIRVAIASNNGEQLDGHFGSCLRFLIYQISATESVLLDVRSTIDADEAEDKNGGRVDLIRDCQVMVVVSIGGPAAAKVVRANIHPVKKPRGGSAADIISELQRVMKGSTPPWIAKHLGVEASSLNRFVPSDDEDGD